jgi:hypothetical protein
MDGIKALLLAICFGFLAIGSVVYLVNSIHKQEDVWRMRQSEVVGKFYGITSNDVYEIYRIIRDTKQ